MDCLQEVRICKAPVHSYTRLSLIATPKQTQCFHLLPTCINFEFRSCFSTTCLRMRQRRLHFGAAEVGAVSLPALSRAKRGLSWITESLRRHSGIKQLFRQAHELLLRLDFAFLENVMRMGMHCVQRNDELVANERAATTCQKQCADLRFALSQAVFFLEQACLIIEKHGKGRRTLSLQRTYLKIA